MRGHIPYGPNLAETKTLRSWVAIFCKMITHCKTIKYSYNIYNARVNNRLVCPHTYFLLVYNKKPPDLGPAAVVYTLFNLYIAVLLIWSRDSLSQQYSSLMHRLN